MLSLSGKEVLPLPGGLLDGVGRRLGRALDGASVLEDGLIGLVYMLGHLWRSTFQGQLRGGEREVRGRRAPNSLGSSLGLRRNTGRKGRGRADGRVWCARVARGQHSWGRCAVKRRGWLLQPAGRGPNILAAHTPAVSPATAALLAGSVNHEPEAARECPAPTPQSCWDPSQPVEGWGF